MASLAKKVNVRMQRCMDQLLALRNGCTPRDARHLEACVLAVRDAQDRIADVFHGRSEPEPDAAPAARPAQAPAARPAAPQQRPPVRTAPAWPPRPLPQIQQSEWPRVQHAIDQVMRGDLELSDVHVPRDSEDGEYVDFCLADMATAYDNAAAQLLAKDKEAWAMMDGSERRKAVRAKAEQIEADDDGSDTYLQFLVHGVSF